MDQTDQPSEDQDHQIRTIVVVEDDAEIGAFMVEALKTEMAFHVLLLPDGAHALETVKTLVPDLFILDYHLPGLTGRELADRFQATEALKAIPIVLMSANRLEYTFSNRPITFLEKPFSLELLLQTVHTLLDSQP